MLDMQVDTFKIKTDAQSGIKYVVKVKDELTKNHAETDSEVLSGFMPQIPGSYYCPVASWEEYNAHLNPECPWLWQTPIDNHKTNVWYANGRVGKNPINSFLQSICKQLKITPVYTNHSLRVTGASILTRAFNYKQVMSVTGHKSMSSLAVYEKVNSDEKISMGLTLGATLMNTTPQEMVAWHDEARAFETLPMNPPGVKAIESKVEPPKKKFRIAAPQQLYTLPENADIQVADEATLKAITDFMEGGNNNVVPETTLQASDAKVLQDLNFNPQPNAALVPMMPQQATTSTSVSTVNNTKTALDMPVFNSCTIGNVIININKN